jgi:hypothetical protein
MQRLSVAAPYARGRSNRRRWRISALTSLLVIAGAGMAMAQSAPGNAAEPNSTVPEKQANPPTSPAVKGSTSNGVIKPKRDVDPDMTNVPPAQGTESMPVVKPKGTPGGPPGPEPK